VTCFFGLVLKIETDGELEIKLHSTTLMRSLQGIEHLDINLGSIESTITWVLLPGLSELVEGLSESSLSLVPHGIVSKLVSWTGREFQLKLESEDTVNVIKEVKHSQDLLHDLLRCAEDVSIILLETSHTGETREGTSDLVTVENTEVTKPDGQLSVGSDGVVEHQAMARAVHRLHAETAVLNLEQIDVVLVVLVMARGLPELEVEHVGGNDF
jgi:hypothetical protein